MQFAPRGSLIKDESMVRKYSSNENEDENENLSKGVLKFSNQKCSAMH